MTKKGNELFSIKLFIIYGITFSLGFWISILILPFIKTTNLVAIFLLTGLILELSAKVCQMILYKKPRITLDKWFLLWVLIHSVVVYGVLFVINKLNIPNQILFILAVGFGIALVTHLIWRIMYRKNKSNHSKLKIKPMEVIKGLLAIFTGFVLIASFYLTFTSFFLGLFVPPIMCIGLAAVLIRFFNRYANGKQFFIDTLALAGVFLLILMLVAYQLLSPIFGFMG